MNRIVSIARAVLLLGAADVAQAQDPQALLQQSDRVAAQESVALRALYEEGNAAFARGDYATAFNTYDYAVWQGSLAAATRLCVLDAYGIGTEANPPKAVFWCAQAAAGGQDVRDVQAWLHDHGGEERVGYSPLK
ncbi:MAG: hypothetical protein K0R03_2277 [Moraxellaceae bacterium]|jgi:TPR repeat protein|nr:hypothetical protein [Moraxellaceae bacterium]